ncbi:MAG: hypothetical protein AAF493_07740 [Pseudomonadota bacterium]
MELEKHVASVLVGVVLVWLGAGARQRYRKRQLKLALRALFISEFNQFDLLLESLKVSRREAEHLRHRWDLPNEAMTLLTELVVRDPKRIVFYNGVLASYRIANEVLDELRAYRLQDDRWDKLHDILKFELGWVARRQKHFVDMTRLWSAPVRFPRLRVKALKHDKEWLRPLTAERVVLWLGMIVTRDELRPEARRALRDLKPWLRKVDRERYPLNTEYETAGEVV